MYFDTKIVSVSSGKVLTVPGSTTQNIPLVLDNDSGAPNQVWRWVSIDDTWSKVVSKASGNLLDAPDPSSGDAPIIALDDGSTVVAVIQCDETGSPNQHWSRDVISPCVFKLRVRSSQRYLEATNYPSGTNSVFQREASDRQDQQWHLVMVDVGGALQDRLAGERQGPGGPERRDRRRPRGAKRRYREPAPAVATGPRRRRLLQDRLPVEPEGAGRQGLPHERLSGHPVRRHGGPEPAVAGALRWLRLLQDRLQDDREGAGRPGRDVDNVPICQWADHGGPNQQWSIVPVPRPRPGPCPPPAPAPASDL